MSIMGIGKAAELVLGNIVVSHIEWDWNWMGVTHPDRFRYPNLGLGGGGFRLNQVDQLSTDYAHRHKMMLDITLEGDLKLKVYRLKDKNLKDQIMTTVEAKLGDRLMSYLREPRAGMWLDPAGKLKPKVPSILLSVGNKKVLLDRNGMIHHKNGKYAGRIRSVNDIRQRNDGSIWLRVPRKGRRRATWKKVQTD